LKAIKQEFTNIKHPESISDYLSNSTFYRLITHKKYANGSYKRSSKVSLRCTNQAGNLERRKLFLEKYLYLISRGYEPIFVEEAGFNTSFHPIRGYSIRNTRLRLNFIGKKSKNQSLLAAVTRK